MANTEKKSDRKRQEGIGLVDVVDLKESYEEKVYGS